MYLFIYLFLFNILLKRTCMYNCMSFYLSCTVHVLTPFYYDLAVMKNRILNFQK